MEENTYPVQTTQPVTPTDPQYPPSTTPPTPFHSRARFIPKWMAIGILIVLFSFFSWFLIKGFLGNTTPPKSQKATTVSPTKKPTPTENPMANWRTYTNNYITFRYPPSWYPRTDPLSNNETDVSFFLTGTQADFSEGDHTGNEMLFVMQILDPIEKIQRERYPNIPITVTGDKKKIRVSKNHSIFELAKTSSLSIMLGKKNPEMHLDQILSTLTFTNQNRDIKSLNDKLSSVLTQLIAAPDKTSFANTHSLIVKDNMVFVTITLADKNFQLPKEIAQETARYENLVDAYVVIDTLPTLSQNPAITFIDTPSQGQIDH